MTAWEFEQGLSGLGGQTWDAVVVGAGPGGSVTALSLARRGRAVLLVDCAVFPRWKVCGACLGRAGIHALDQLRLGGLLHDCGARAVGRTDLLWRGRRASVGMDGIRAVSRRSLDSGLARAAVEAGVVARFGVRGELSGEGRVRLSDGAGEIDVSCRAVVHASGLKGASVKAGATVSGSTRIGLGVAETGHDAKDDHLLMAVGTGGYVGRIVTSDGVATWGAAVQASEIRRAGSPAAAVRELCAQAGADIRVPQEGWTGTPALTRRVLAQAGSEYRVGDAAGYIEPITGEGMSWAIIGGAAAAPAIDRAIRSGRHGAHWARLHAQTMRWRRIRCAMIARGLRSGPMMHAAFAVLQPGGRNWSGFQERLVSCLIGGRV